MRILIRGFGFLQHHHPSYLHFPLSVAFFGGNSGIMVCFVCTGNQSCCSGRDGTGTCDGVGFLLLLCFTSKIHGIGRHTVCFFGIKST